MGAREHGRAVEQVMCDERDRAVLGDIQETPLGPFVESPHRGPAPDLIVKHSIRDAGISPTGGLAKIGTEHQGELMFGVFLGALHLGRIALEEKLPGLGPDGIQRLAEEVFLERRPHGGRQRLDRVVGSIHLVEFRAAHGEHRPALEDLDLHAQLEHVGRGRHDDVGLPGLGQHLAHAVGGAGLHASLVDRAGHDVGRAHHVGRGGRGRGGDAAGRAHARRPGEAVLGLDPVAQRDDRGQEADERPVVGVTAAVGLDRHVLSQRDLGGQRGLVGRDQPRGGQLAQHRLGGGREELLGDLRP